MTLHLFVYYLMVVPHLLLGVVLIGLLRNKVYRQFPIFLAYVVVEIVQFFAVLFPLVLMRATTGNTYAIGYSASLALSTLLRFGIIYEIFNHLFRNYKALNRFGRPMFRWAMVGLFLAAIAVAAYAGGNDFNHFIYVVRVLDRTASIMQCGLMLGLFLFSAYLGLSWRSHVFGIALGMGIFASVELAASAFLSQTGYTYTTYVNYVTMGTYHLCVLIWAFYLLAPERSPRYKVKVKTVPEHDLESWNRELQRFIHQ
jgi:hypothetical protein